VRAVRRASKDAGHDAAASPFEARRWRAEHLRVRSKGLRFVMPALVAGIHVLDCSGAKDVDGRDKPGHDDTERAERGEARANLTTALTFHGTECHAFRAGADPGC